MDHPSWGCEPPERLREDTATVEVRNNCRSTPVLKLYLVVWIVNNIASSGCDMDHPSWGCEPPERLQEDTTTAEVGNNCLYSTPVVILWIESNWICYLLIHRGTVPVQWRFNPPGIWILFDHHCTRDPHYTLTHNNKMIQEVYSIFPCNCLSIIYLDRMRILNTSLRRTRPGIFCLQIH